MRFGQIVRPSSGSLEIHIKEVWPRKRVLQFIIIIIIIIAIKF